MRPATCIDFMLIQGKFKSEREPLCSSMTIPLGSMLIVGLSLLFAALKLT